MIPNDAVLFAVGLTTSVLTLITAAIGLLLTLVNRGKLQEVHVLVNSNMTAIKKELATAQATIANMRAYIEASQPGTLVEMQDVIDTKPSL